MTSSLRLKFLLVAVFAILLGLGAAKYQASVLIAVMDPEDEEESDEECTSSSCGEEEESDAGDTTEPPPPPPPPACTEDKWSCDGKFSACSDDGVQTQKCTLSFDCPTVKTPAPSTKKCTPPPPPPPPPPACTEDKWSCDGKWSACSADGVQTQKCSLAVDCEAVKTPAPSTKKCTPPPPTPPPATNEQPAVTPSEDEEETTEEIEIPEEEPTVNAEEEAKLREQEEQLRKQQEEAARAALEAAHVERAEAEAQLAAFSKSAGVSSSSGSSGGDGSSIGAASPALPAAPDPKADSDRDGIPDTQDQYPTNPDVNGNGVPDGTDVNLGKSYTVVDQEDVQLRTEVAVVKKQLETEGKSKTEVEKVVQATFKKKRAGKKQANLREVSLKKFRHEIKDEKGDADKDGISDTVAVALGIDPTDKTKPEKGFASTAEMKIYSANATALKAKKVTMNVYNGNILAKAGATILATCESGASYTLAAYNEKGKRTVLAKEICAENNKMAFVTDHSKLPQGKYLLQIVKDRSPVSFVPYLAVLPPVALAAGDNASDPVLVDIVTDTQVPQPVVQSIEGLDVAGLKDIKVEAGEDGRIRVSGSSDISTMVVGTFKSAIFTSAMLADIDSGFFEVVSPRPLEDGDHEVVIYATRPEEAVQSQPVRLRFSIIPTAKAATDEELVGGEPSDGEVRSSAEASTSSSSQTTLMLIVGGAVVLVAAGVVVIRWKKTVV